MQRSIVWYFGALAAFAVAAFWPSYFAAPPYGADFLYLHFHGAAMFAWFALLLTQATLARAGRLADHRMLGKVSYALVPLIVVSTLLLSHLRAHDTPAAPDVVWFLYVQLSLIAFFALCFGWAIANRRRPMLHMRFMAGTALAAVDPIFARLLYNHFGIEPPLVQLLTYGSVIGVLGGMMWRERRNREVAAVWLRMVVAYVLLEAPTFFVTQTAAWRAFVAWYGELPLP